MAATFREHGREDPQKDVNNNIAQLLRQQLRSYKKDDPKTVEQKALPLCVIRLILSNRSSELQREGPSMVQLVRGSLIESLDRGSNPWLGPHMSSHSPLGPRIQGPGYRWFKDSSWKAGTFGQGFKPLMGSLHIASRSPLRSRILGKFVKNHPTRKRDRTPGIG